jgi:hypothetical protein
MVVGVILVGYIGYRYVANQIKKKQDMQNMVNADINALNTSGYNASAPQPATKGFLSTITFGLL